MILSDEVAVWWLRQKNLTVSDENVQLFLDEATPVLEELKSAARQNVLSQRVPGVDSSEFEVMVARAVNQIRTHYKVPPAIPKSVTLEEKQIQSSEPASKRARH